MTTDRINRASPPLRCNRRALLAEDAAVDDFVCAEGLQIGAFLCSPGGGNNAISQSGEKDDGNRSHSAARTRYQNISLPRRNSSMLQRQYAQHCRISGSTD